ncbi:MAG: tetratricopeptide repeat protein [Myxococcales bacterium]|nr:tetratricopeptide repeat protein [Myxococcales bacterium]MCB9702293.1 tetratricopeptide repeat protein [Myxococcales bacterium]
MSGEISNDPATPTWLGLGEDGPSAGVGRIANLVGASVLAIGGIWLLGGAGGQEPELEPEPPTVAAASGGDGSSGKEPEKTPDKEPEKAPEKAPKEPEKAPEKEPAEAATGSGGEAAPPTEAATATAGADAAKGEPASADALVKRGEAALKSGKRSSAKRLFEEALTIEPQNAGAMMGLSNLSFDAGNYPSAERWARQAVQIAPRNADYRVRLGDAYFKLKQFDRARAQYERAEKMGHPFAKARLSRLPKGK